LKTAFNDKSQSKPFLIYEVEKTLDEKAERQEERRNAEIKALIIDYKNKGLSEENAIEQATKEVDKKGQIDTMLHAEKKRITRGDIAKQVLQMAKDTASLRGYSSHCYTFLLPFVDAGTVKMSDTDFQTMYIQLTKEVNRTDTPEVILLRQEHLLSIISQRQIHREQYITASLSILENNKL
jgi:hypothetical protein